MTDIRPPRQRIGAAEAALRFNTLTEPEKVALRRQIKKARREIAGDQSETPTSTFDDGHKEAQRRFGTQQKDDNS